jgi:ABC-type transporter Mla subunit MlaD
MTAVWNSHAARYEHFDRTNKFWMRAEEAPAVTEQLERLVGQVEKALPGFLALTNQIARVLNNTSDLTSNLNSVALDARPAVSNLTALSAQLRGQGALGAWLLSAEGQANVERSLAGTPDAITNANRVLTNADAALTALAENLARSLDNLAGITSNLNNQVQANTNMLKAISDAVVHADELLQGLKRHWLLRSAFKAKATNAAPVAPAAPLRSPRDSE